MRAAWILLFPSAVACWDGGRGVEGEPADTAQPPEALGADVADPATPGNTFDAGTLEPADTLLGLRVISVDMERVLEDSIWIGTVLLEGDPVLHGVYRSHPDWPVVTAPCFHVVQPASIARVPRRAPDPWTVEDPRTWFCFEDSATALEQLGSTEPSFEAVIAVDRYRVRRDLADAFDTASLAEVLEFGPLARATLREE